MSTADAEPITVHETPALFESLTEYHHLYLAVSGGLDSMALMHLIAEWRDNSDQQPAIDVLAVDHGLRPEAAAEASAVAVEAAKLGLAAHILTGSGKLPTTGVQEAARQLRYRLLLDFIESDTKVRFSRGRSALVTAHHRDDLAETVLMRLGRGAGVDGLAAMRSATRISGDVDLVRPLLQLPKARLRATCEARSVAWFEDPSNLSGKFERVRMRQAAAARSALGLGDAALARTAARMGRARDALEFCVDRALAPSLADPLLNSCGFFRWNWRPGELPDEIAIRLLMRVLPAVGGWIEPMRLMRVERLHEAMQKRDFAGATLANCVIVPSVGGDGSRFMVYREPDRAPLPVIETELDKPFIWDNRFEISMTKTAAPRRKVRLRPLVRSDIELRRLDLAAEGTTCPRAALFATPVIEDATGAVCIPALNVHEVTGIVSRFRLERLASRFGGQADHNEATIKQPKCLTKRNEIDDGSN